MTCSVLFAELADYLQDFANRDGFDNQFFKIGPLSLTLSVAQDCADMDFGVALSSGGSVSKTESNLGLQPQTSLTVYVLQLSISSLKHFLQPFFSGQHKTLPQLSGPDHAQQFFVRDDQRKVLKVYDQKNGIGLLAFEDRELLPSWELYSPIKEFIHLHALNQSCVLLHAASLVSPDRPEQGALIVGPGGSGKSTLTAYAIEQGMLTNGDDYVLVDLRQDKPLCWSVYRTLKLHPSSPVSQGKSPWRVWRTDALTGKSVILADSVDQGGALAPQSKLNRVCGLSIQQSPVVHNPKANSILSDPHRHPYLHICMSTIQQIQYRMDATLALSKKLHQSISYSAYTMAPGIPGLQQALLEIQGQVR